ncbi:S8 family serine peptidase [Actinoplanes sp. NPDC023801]|uniref:S8 family serine peptidase n=1 Tax=Actinoplanes sp. NPDC023801 TaxID=3154595 RepID=UPI0033D9870E
MVKVRLLRSAAGAVAAGVLAAVGVYALPTGSAGWEPITYGLTQDPGTLLPPVVSQTRPARVVSTTVGADGKPVVRVKEATDRDVAVELIKDGQQADGAVSVEIDARVHALGAPTGPDPLRSRQWSLATMRVAEAWPVSTGEGVIVAVIDTGVDSQHPDLAANVLSGYDATTDAPGESTDVHGHGTHVAGTIASVTGNNAGVTAVAPDVRILPVKALSDDGSGHMSDAAEGVVWAAGNGAQVINMSLGGPERSAALSNAIAYARSMGVTVIAAAGNERTEGSPVSYPGADEGVIAVAATTASDTVAYYSNAGDYVDVAAPGSGIISTYPVARGSYASSSGTSMASPHVAATAALLKAYQPALTPDQIEDALERSAVDLGTPGFDIDHGYGRVDAVAALAAVTPVIEPPTVDPTTETPTAEPTTEAPTVDPTTETPTAEPTTEAPTVDPTTETPTAEPTTETPTAEPTTETPTADPTTEAPTVEPTTAVPTVEPTTAVPTVEPTTAAPTVDPTTEAPMVPPVTDVPVARPTMDVPAAAPPREAPNTAPTTAPTMGAPTTSAPATAPTAGPTVGPTVNPTPTSTPAPMLNPVVTANVRNLEVTYGTRTSVRFAVRVSGVAAARQPVRICVSTGGAPVTCTTAMTGADGAVTVWRTATAGFRVHAEVAATRTTNGATSTVATFTVRAKVAVKRTAKGAITVKLTGATGQTVRVQRYVNHTWRTVHSVKAKPEMTVRGLIRGQRYRVVVPDTATVLGVTGTAITA